MSSDLLSSKAARYLQTLCNELPSRSVGTLGNRAATAFFRDTVAAFGWATETPEFECIDWHNDGARLVVGEQSFEAFVSPYALGGHLHAPLVVVSTDAELEAAELAHKIVLLRGETTKEQLMPKNFAFYNPDRHRHIIALLEAKRPLAIITATARDLEMVGSQYPFPMFEDGDFDIPSVYLTDVEGEQLAEHSGAMVELEIRAERIPSRGCNVIARKGANPHRRVVLMAHIDARMGTPGACDNAGGTVVLLLVAELLAQYSGELGVELVAMNGEDYYANPGEMQYLALNQWKFAEIILGINIDGVGYYRGKTACSLYNCPEKLANTIRRALSPYKGIIEGEFWYQGDHGLYLMNGTPALAFTSELAAELMAEIVHTAKDTPAAVEPLKLVGAAHALRDLVLLLNEQPRE